MKTTLVVAAIALSGVAGCAPALTASDNSDSCVRTVRFRSGDCAQTQTRSNTTAVVQRRNPAVDQALRN